MTMPYKSYPFYVVTKTGRIASGWSHREDAKDFVKDNPGHGLRVVTRGAAKKAGTTTWATGKNQLAGVGLPRVAPARVDIWTAASMTGGAAGAFFAATRPFSQPWHVVVGSVAGAAVPLIISSVLASLKG